jgi:hypothetical protein
MKWWHFVDWQYVNNVVSLIFYVIAFLLLLFIMAHSGDGTPTHAHMGHSVH